MGKLAQQQKERGRGKLPSNTEVNPRETCMAITIRGGKVIEPIEKPIKENVVQGKMGGKEDEKDEIPKPNPSVTSFSKEDAPYVPPIPFPQQLKRHQDESNFQ
ncbi:hypothetical protein CCACVL1_30108, partial [Corchorus capsularis]